jgi:hypothetical protein
MSANKSENRPDATPAESDQWLRVVQQQVASLGFGEVIITVHDSKVVQIEKTEKLRLPQKK